MKAVATLPPETTISRSHRSRRARSFSRPKALLWGATLLFVAFFALIGFFWQLTELLVHEQRSNGYWALGLLAVFGSCRLLAFIHNRNLTCPLCHGTILHEKRCRKHADARRLPGLSYRATVVLSTLFTGLFRCMYCGTHFRLKK